MRNDDMPMNSPSELPLPPPIQFNTSPPPAFLLNIDGTLVDFAASPDDAQVPPRVLRLLMQLRERTGGALALVSGRDTDSIDRLFYPLHLPAAGVHGGQLRFFGGLRRTARSTMAIEDIARAARTLARGRPGLLVEMKQGLAVALHYRCAPDARLEIEEFAAQMLERHPGICVAAGNQMVEIRGEGYDKGRAVDALMESQPFRGRVPVYLGDDVTDEDAFLACRRHGGHGILVGEPRATHACFQLDGVDAALAWLTSRPGHETGTHAGHSAFTIGPVPSEVPASSAAKV